MTPSWSAPARLEESFRAILSILDCYLTLVNEDLSTTVARPTAVTITPGSGRDTVSGASASGGTVSGTIDCGHTSGLSDPSYVTFSRFVTV